MPDAIAVFTVSRICSTLNTSRTIVTFGQSADPASPHFFDQAPLYARGEMKDAWFHADEVERAARRSYRPGPAADSTALR